MEQGDDMGYECRCLATDGSGSSNPDDPLEVDALLESLEHPRRRYLIYAVAESTELALPDVAAQIVAWEEGVPLADAAEADRERAYVVMYHAHVPKLEREGVVAFDRGSETVRLGPNGRQALNALQAIGGSKDAELEEHARNADRD